jgi:hypothetical protein
MVTSLAVEQVGPFEAGPVATVDRNVVAAGLEHLALVGLDHTVVGAVGGELLRLDRVGDVIGGQHVTVCVPLSTWYEIVAIWNMYSEAVLTSGSFGSMSPSTTGKFQSSFSSDMIACAPSTVPRSMSCRPRRS